MIKSVLENETNSSNYIHFMYQKRRTFNEVIKLISKISVTTKVFKSKTE